MVGSGAETRYMALSGGNSNSTTEALTQVPFYSGGTLNNLKVRVESSDTDGTMIVRTRIAGANGNQSVTLTAAGTGLFEDTTNSDTVATTNKVNYQLAPGTATTGNPICLASISFDASSNTAQLFIVNAQGNAFTDNVNTTIYGPVNGITPGAGGSPQETTENNSEFTMKTGGTLRNGSWYVTSNARTVTTTSKIRVAGADGNVSIAVTAGSTGLFQDTSNTDTVVSGNTINWSVTSSPAESQNLSGAFAAIEFISTDSTWESICGPNSVGGTSQSAANTSYGAISGVSNLFTTTEADRNTKIPFNLTASNLSIYIVTNGGTTNGSLTLRKNTADTTLTLVITALTTGLFVDDTNTVSVSNGDSICLKLVTGATAATLTGAFGFKALTESAVVAAQTHRFFQLFE